MTPGTIQRLRHRLGENTKTFGARFGRSGRTVEGWEQGRRTPDILVRRQLNHMQRQLRDSGLRRT